jgi:hypothetical protein
MPISYFGDWNILSFLCGAGTPINVVPTAGIPGSYGDWDGNFDYWTDNLNPLITDKLVWFSLGKPCHRVMTTIACKLN